MAKHNNHRRWGIPALLALCLLFLALAVTPAPGFAQEGAQQGTEEYCLSCHGNPSLEMTLPSGETLSLYISEEQLSHSVHSPLGIECQACHTNIQTYPHPPVTYENLRELSLSYYLSCQKCHSVQYEETLDSMHAEVALQGNLDAPVCTDCHGSHYVEPPDEPRGGISQICGRCHTEIFETYADSVHGEALLEQSNPDVPVCTDCHGVHNIQDPRTMLFRIEEPELCAGCHANPELMGKYGISSDVYDIYQLSWHGVDVSVFQARWPTLWHNSAICSDCHGIHNILSTENRDSMVHPNNLLETCRECHEGAPPNFVGAWTGHYRISLERTPFVFYTEVFYKSFAYFVLAVSAIYVLLQIFRATVARARRSL